MHPYKGTWSQQREFGLGVSSRVSSIIHFCSELSSVPQIHVHLEPRMLSLFGNSLAGVIKDLAMNHPGFEVDLRPHCLYFYENRKGHCQGRSHVKMRQRSEGCSYQPRNAEDCGLEASRGKERFLPRTFRESILLLTP